MKKLFILLTTLFMLANVSAQDVDSLQTNPLQTQIDSLSVKLSALQYDHDYLRCEYDILVIDFKLTNLAQDATMKGDQLLIYTKAKSFNWEYYDAAKANYESYVDFFNTLKESVRITKENVERTSSKFSPLHSFLLKNKCRILDSEIDIVDKALNVYKISLNDYRYNGR